MTTQLRYEQKGYFDIVVKEAPEDSVALSLKALSPGQSFISAKGPIPFHNFQYKANMRETIHMIAGGSGITVMLQVLIILLPFLY